MARECWFLVENLSAEKIHLTKEESHHLLHVLRLNKGDQIILFDGNGRSVRALIEDTTPSNVRARQLEPLKSNESSQNLTLALAVPMTAVMTEIVRHATELGVDRFIPLTSDNAKFSLKNLQSRIPRWHRIAIEACKQSHRSTIPSFDEPQSFRTAIASASPGVTLLGSQESPPLQWSGPPPTSTRLFVGPEGGWSERELQIAKEEDAQVFGLGPRTLRVETAVLAAVTLVQYFTGDLRQMQTNEHK